MKVVVIDLRIFLILVTSVRIRIDRFVVLIRSRALTKWPLALECASAGVDVAVGGGVPLVSVGCFVLRWRQCWYLLAWRSRVLALACAGVGVSVCCCWNSLA